MNGLRHDGSRLPSLKGALGDTEDLGQLDLREVPLDPSRPKRPADVLGLDVRHFCDVGYTQ